MGAYPKDRSNDPMGPITYGRDFNFFANVAPTSVTAGVFNFAADVCITFPSYTVTFILQDGYAGSIQYSFNGTTVHGDMNNFAGSQTASLSPSRTDRLPRFGLPLLVVIQLFVWKPGALDKLRNGEDYT